MKLSTSTKKLEDLNNQFSKQYDSKTLTLAYKAQSPFWIELHEKVVEGVLIFTEQTQLVYINDDARKVLGRLQKDSDSNNDLPEEIIHICQSLIHSRNFFPHQNWSVELDIVTQDSSILHIRSRWLRIDTQACPYLLLIVEDRQQAVSNIVLEEAKQYGLTSREKEVWVLYRNGKTYKQVASELKITTNTVKKHMKSIHAKRRQDR
ncbi:MAG: helix-turn-helix transcriptional regulator [Leptolyngbyaceae cyanobacterium]